MTDHEHTILDALAELDRWYPYPASGNHWLTRTAREALKALLDELEATRRERDEAIEAKRVLYEALRAMVSGGGRA